MSEFVNYNKRGITLPPGCKDLSDLLKPKGLRNAPGPILAVEQPPVVREETLTATLAEIEQHVAMVFQSQARLFALEIFLPGEPASVQIIRWERMEISASVVFGKGAEPERAMR